MAWPFVRALVFYVFCCTLIRTSPKRPVKERGIFILPGCAASPSLAVGEVKAVWIRGMGNTAVMSPPLGRRRGKVGCLPFFVHGFDAGGGARRSSARRSNFVRQTGLPRAEAIRWLADQHALPDKPHYPPKTVNSLSAREAT
jgi:hypothetical protein